MCQGVVDEDGRTILGRVRWSREGYEGMGLGGRDQPPGCLGKQDALERVHPSRWQMWQMSLARLLFGRENKLGSSGKREKVRMAYPRPRRAANCPNNTCYSIGS